MNDPPHDSSDSSKSKRGRKRGCNLEQLNLSFGGIGGRAVGDSIHWILDRGYLKSSERSDYSSESSDSSEKEEEELGEKEMNCVTDLQGNGLLPIGKIIGAISNDMCCSKCAITNHNSIMNEFIDFSSNYEENVRKEENGIPFYSKLKRLEWREEKHKSTKELFTMYNGGKAGDGSNEERLIKNFMFRKNLIWFL